MKLLLIVLGISIGTVVAVVGIIALWLSIVQCGLMILEEMEDRGYGIWKR